VRDTDRQTGDSSLGVQAGVDAGPWCRGRDGAEGEESWEGGGAGSYGAGMYGLLRCVVEDMCSGEALETRPLLAAQQWLEAAEVQAGPGRPFRAGMEVSGQTEVGVGCDGVASQEVVKLSMWRAATARDPTWTTRRERGATVHSGWWSWRRRSPRARRSA
jgi:hypothetical protein